MIDGLRSTLELFVLTDQEETTTCTPTNPEPTADAHIGAEFESFEPHWDGRVVVDEVFRCRDCGVRWRQ